MIRKLKFPAKGAQDFATAGVPDPAAHLVGLSAVIGTGAIKNRTGVAGGEGWDFGRQQIPEQAAPVVEAEMFAVFRRGVAGRAGPADGRTGRRRLRTQDRGGSTIAKDAPAGQLTVARAKQVTLAGWTRPKKQPK